MKRCAERGLVSRMQGKGTFVPGCFRCGSTPEERLGTVEKLAQDIGGPAETLKTSAVFAAVRISFLPIHPRHTTSFTEKRHAAIRYGRIL